MVGGPGDGGGHALAAVGGGVDVARAGGSPLPRVKALVDVLAWEGVESGVRLAGGVPRVGSLPGGALCVTLGSGSECPLRLEGSPACPASPCQGTGSKAWVWEQVTEVLCLEIFPFP